MKQEYLKEVIQIEADAVRSLLDQVDASYEEVLDMILACKGRVIISGIGKSGHIGKKIAASFASLGTPSFFVHSTEAFHGDLGMIQKGDVVILISNSGNSEEVVRMVPIVKSYGAKTVAFTSKKDSKLAAQCDAAIIYQYGREAEDFSGLAPTSSSTVTLVIGDALAVAAARMRGFTKEDYLRFHPGGSIGSALKKDAH